MKNEKRKRLSHFALFTFLFSLIVFAGCAGTPKTATIELYGNPSVGDSYSCTISPEGVVRQVSRNYASHAPRRGPPIAGVGGTSAWTFEAIAEGEAEIVVYNHYRGGTPRRVVTYKALVDDKLNLTLTEWKRHGDGRPGSGRAATADLPRWIDDKISDAPEDALIGIGKAKLDTPRLSRTAAQARAHAELSRQLISIVVRDLLRDYMASSDAGIEEEIAFAEHITAALSADKLAGFRILDEDTDDYGAFYVVLMLSKADAIHIIEQAAAAAKLAVPAMSSFDVLDRINEAFEKIYDQQLQVVEQ